MRTLTLLSPGLLAEHYVSGCWRDETIYAAVRARADETPNRVAIREASRVISYIDLIDAADRLAGALRHAGLGPGDRVAVWLPSRLEVAAAVLACSRQGFVLCPSLHRTHTVAEVIELVGLVGAAALIAEPGYGADGHAADVFAASAEVASLRFVLPLPPRGDAGPRVLDRLPDEPVDKPVGTADSIVYLAFTSGTSGRPKGVMHSDNTLLAPARCLARDWAFSPESVIYSMAPLSHNLGFGALLVALLTGAEFVVHDLPPGMTTYERLRETKSTFLYGVPAHAMDLLAEMDQDPHGRLDDLRGFRISGASVPRHVAETLLSRGIVPQSGYGMTEAGSHNYTLPDTDPRLIVETSGAACAAYELRVFSLTDPDVELPAGQVGQLAGRGASLMLGYFNDQFATEQAFNRAGWFLTGDVGWLDERGNVSITGRLKELIIRGGHNIHPAKIENLALLHPAIERAAAIPVADERLGERVCLVISTAPGRSVTDDELMRHLEAAGLSRYDRPEYLIRVETMPQLASGKLAKRALLAAVAEGRLHPEPVNALPATTAG